MRTPSPVWLAAFASVVATATFTPAAATPPPPVALTADTAGVADGCPSCPAGTSLGGIARRAAAIQPAQAGEPLPLLLDAGNAFFGIDSPDGAVLAAAYHALGYDAINLSYRDFRQGLDRTQQLIRGASLPVVSANLLDDDGDRLFPDFVIVQSGTHKTAVIGVTERPASLDVLPYLRQQLAGIRIADPGEALADVLPRARAQTDRVVLLIYGRPQTVASLTRRFGDQVDLIGVGGSRPRELLRLNEERGSAVLASEPDGTHITVFRPATGAARSVPLTKDLPSDPDVLAAVTRARPTLPAPPALEKLGATSGQAGMGAGLRVEVRDLRKADPEADDDVPENHIRFILDAVVENDLPLDLAFGGGRQAGERVRIDLRQKLLLVVQPPGTAPAATIALVTDRPENNRLPASFELSTLGSTAQGRIAFDLPADLAAADGTAIELRLYHDEFPPAVVAVRGALTPPPDAEPAAANLYVALDAPTVRFPEQLAGQPPPPGMKWVEVDLSGRAVGTAAPPAAPTPAGIGGALGAALNPQAAAEPPPADAPPAPAKPATYLEAPSHLQLVADGQWARTREPSLGTLPPEPVFLPDRPTGGTAVFLAPADAESLELQAVFPLLKEALGPGTSIKPDTLRLPIAGEPTEPPAEQALIAVDDTPVAMALVAATAHDDAVGPFTPEAGRRLVVLDVRLRNDGDEDGAFAPAKRFRGDGIKPLGVVGRGDVPLDDSLLLPAKSRRAVRVVLSVPADAADAPALAMNYAGIAVNPAFDLPLDPDAPHRTAATDDTPAEPLAASTAENTDTNTTSTPDTTAATATPATPTTSTDSPAPGFDWARPGSLATRDAPPGDVPLLAAVQAVGENRAVRLAIESAELVDTVGTSKARADSRYLVLHTRWTNLQPAADGEAPPAYTARLRDTLHLVLNGRQIVTGDFLGDDALPTSVVVPPAADTKAWTTQAKQGDAGPPPRDVTGTLAYTVPRGALRSVSLHLLDPAAGNIALKVVGTPPAETPPLPPASNRIVQAAPFGWRVDDVARRPAQVDLVVDLRARSLRAADPADFAGHATPVQHLPRQWKEGRLHLVIDGKFATHVTDAQLDGKLRLLPDATVGGTLRFRVSRALLEQAQRVELVFGFDETAMPGEAILRPDPIVFALKDGPAAAPTASSDALWHIDDGNLVVSAVSSQADAGVVTLRTQIHNQREVDAWFNPYPALRLIPAGGEALALDATKTSTTAVPAPAHRRPLWIPSGATRVFDVAFKSEGLETDGLKTDAPAPVLRYTGLLRRLDIPLTAGATPQPPAMPRIADRPLYDRDRQPGGIASVGLTGAQVNRAIERGRDWLWDELRADIARGRVLGDGTYHLAVLLALVHADAHHKYPDFDAALRDYLDRARPLRVGGHATYKNGLLAMTVASYGDPAYRPLLRDVAHYLVEDQGPDGTWNYNTQTPPRLFALPDVPEPDTQKQTQAVALRVTGGPPTRPTAPSDVDANLQGDAMRRHLAWATNGDGDNSVTQFAALGLLACEQAGIGIDPDVWRRLLQSIWGRQSKSGGWGYSSGGPYGSMTCAGAGMAAIAMRQLEPDRDPLEDPRLRHGLAWLAEKWQVGQNPVDRDDWIYYHTYGIERVGRLLDTEFLGPHEWYPTLAKWLIDQQAEDGDWPAGADRSPRLSTTFALLFLIRATETLDPDQLARERAAAEAARPTTGKLEMRAAAQPGRSVLFVLDASGSMLSPPGDVPRAERRGADLKFDLARAAVAAAVADLPDGVPVGLVAYGHRTRATDADADTDVEVVVPVGPLDRAAFTTRLNALRARGKTPLALALDTAVKALGRARGATIILLTDGGQGREPGDPVASARALGEAGPTLHVIGFDIAGPASRQAEAWSAQLQAMARAAAGTYVPVDAAAGLTPAVAAASTGSPGAYELLDSAGAIIAEGDFGGTLDLAPGPYTFRAHPGGTLLEAPVTITRGRTTAITFDADAMVAPGH